MNFLLWNVGGKDLSELVAAVAIERSIDVIVLIESGTTSSEMLTRLNQSEVSYFDLNGRSQCDKVKLYGRFEAKYARPVYESSRVSIRRLTLPLRREILLCGVHLGDKRNNSAESQNEQCTKLAADILRVESQEGLSATVLLGDFNMNPFESGIIKANGLHATMSRTLAREESRVIAGETYPYFYNPMWSLFNDARGASVGTYYYRRAELVNYQWNVFDQVLFRPSLVNRFNLSELAILDHAGGISLTKHHTGIPDKEKFSDHLPITFQLDLHP